MAFVSADIKINEVGAAIGVKLYFPTDLPDYVGNRVKGVITLLHGMGNNPADWMQYSAACRYAADNGYVLIAPDGQNSFFCNMRHGLPWHTIVADLLPAQLQKIFNIPTGRGENYIAGLSMGGYGAMLLGLSHPERYAAIGSFSGSLDMVSMAADTASPVSPFLRSIFGEELAVPPENDLFHLATRVAALPREEQPRMYCSCGAQDELQNIHGQNRRFCKHAEALPLDYHYDEWPGIHEWNFWDRSLARFIGFIQNSNYGQRKQADWSSAALLDA